MTKLPDTSTETSKREFRRGGISPRKRLELLMLEHATDKLPPAFIAGLMDVHRKETVTADGIAFEYKHDTYKYKDLNSVLLTEEWVGREVLVRFDPLAPEICYVLEPKTGRLIDVLPAKGKVQWFDHAAAQRELHKHRAHLERTEAHLRHIHKPDTDRALKRSRKNAEAIQIVNTFPVPEGPESRVGETPLMPKPIHSTRRERGISFERVDKLEAARAGLQLQRERHQRRSASNKDLAARADAALLRAASRPVVSTQPKETSYDDSY